MKRPAAWPTTRCPAPNSSTAPARLAKASKPLALDALLPQIIEDHQHLTAGKSLQLCLAPLSPCKVITTPGVVRAAVGNLLRNAIENSDNGRIDIRLQDDATIVIHNPGHGISPAQRDLHTHGACRCRWR